MRYERLTRQHWLSDAAAMDTTPALAQRAGASVATALDHIRRVPLITPRMERWLLPVDALALQAGRLGSNPEGLCKL